VRACGWEDVCAEGDDEVAGSDIGSEDIPESAQVDDCEYSEGAEAETAYEWGVFFDVG
jgi:hypothetical protein